MGWPQTVRKSDLRLDYYRGSGKGGQHRNKTDSACRITHLPTGLVAQCEDQRSQGQNRRMAFRRLTDKLVPLMRKAAQPQRREVSQERVRTYHEPRQEVRDERLSRRYDYTDVIHGHGLDTVLLDLVKEGA